MNYSVHPQANISNNGSSNSNGNEADTDIEFIGQIMPVLVRMGKDTVRSISRTGFISRLTHQYCRPDPIRPPPKDEYSQWKMGKDVVRRLNRGEDLCGDLVEFGLWCAFHCLFIARH